MKFIKNRPAWLRWKRAEMGTQEGITEPKRYPCYAYTSVLSFGYEERQEHYLYLEDLRAMSAKFDKPIKCKRCGGTGWVECCPPGTYMCRGDKLCPSCKGAGEGEQG